MVASSGASGATSPAQGVVVRGPGEVPGSLAMSAECVLQILVPRCSGQARARLRQERVLTAADLAGLDRDDLRALGLTMGERSKVLSWARQFFSPVTTPAGSDDILKGTAAFAQVFSPPLLASPWGSKILRLISDDDDPLEAANLPDTAWNEEADQSQHLDNVESNAGFWCRLVRESGSKSSLCSDVEQAEELLRRGGEICLGDLRENVLEKLFDLSPERLKEVYESIDQNSDGKIKEEELREGLHRYELHGLDGAVEKVLNMVSRDSNSMRFDEFESVLTRLKLAQLLSVSKCQNQSVAGQLMILDYSSHRVEERRISLQDFFFGHRLLELPMRWVHLRQLDLVLLLALTAKYQLHPLSVEDVIDQAPTKIDRYEGHYFVSIEHLEVTSAISGLEPVKIRGSHVTLFCAGPPHLDTIITVSQAERSFQQDWPGQVLPDRIAPTESAWVGRLRKRLQAVRSRVRERHANFLMYEILDLCTDDFRLVMQVYTKRLNWLEERLQRATMSSEEGKLDWFNEVGIVRLQLAVVSRRLRGLQHVLRRLADDPDMALLLSGYLQDVIDHIDEAYEDARHLGDKCLTLSAAYEHAEDRAHEKIRREAERVQGQKDERMNKMLFILTIFTTAFTPLTFASGVYGMNFVDKRGTPTIPELLNPHGYQIFLTFTFLYLIASCVVGIWLWKRVKRGTVKGRSFGSCWVQANAMPSADCMLSP